jgi:hypothetical protein
MLLEPICFAKVHTATTAKQAWMKLKEAYEDKGWVGNYDYNRVFGTASWKRVCRWITM